MVNMANKHTEYETYLKEYDDQASYDIAVGEMIGAFLCINILNLALKNMNIITSYSLSVFFGVVFVVCLIHKRKKLFRPNVLAALLVSEIIFTFLLLLTCLRFSQSAREMLSRCIYTGLFCIPLFVLARKVKDMNILIKGTETPAKFVILIASIEATYLHFRPAYAIYNMPLGYALLYPTAVFCARRKEGVVNVVFMLWGLALMILIGSRGPILGFLVVFGLSQLSDMHNTKEIVKKFFLFTIVSIIIFNLDWIIENLLALLNSFNIQSRSLQMIAGGYITFDSGRNTFYKTAINAINQSPLIGYGVSGDIPAMGGYPHNVFLEMLIDFGYPVGMILCILLSVKLLTNFRQKSRREKEAYYVFFAAGFVPLLLSNTFLQAPIMWILMGLLRNKYIRVRLFADRSKKHNE